MREKALSFFPEYSLQTKTTIKMKSIQICYCLNFSTEIESNCFIFHDSSITPDTPLPTHEPSTKFP